MMPIRMYRFRLFSVEGDKQVKVMMIFGGGEASYLYMILRIIKNVEDRKSHLPMTLDNSPAF